jgi:hypothetical protein
MSQVARSFPEYAPFAFTLRAVCIAGHLRDDRAGWIYSNLIGGRIISAVLTTAAVVVRYRSMAADPRVSAIAALRHRFPRALFWFPSTFGVELEGLEPSWNNFSAIVHLSRGVPKWRRRRLLTQAVTLLITVLNEQGEGRSRLIGWDDQYPPIAEFYKQADKPTRMQIRKAIAGCADEGLRLCCEVCLFSVLPEAERVELGPRLLREIGASPLRERGIHYNERFPLFLVLFLHSTGEVRTKSLIAMLRVGAHMWRSSWLSRLGRLPEAWPINMQAQVGTHLVEAAKDASTCGRESLSQNLIKHCKAFAA